VIVSGSAVSASSSPSFRGLASAGGALARMQADREELTGNLRRLAAQLDEIDRQMSELAWPHRTAPATGNPSAERAALESRRRGFNTRLRALVGQLNDLDQAISALKGYEEWTPDRVGVCPHCGYPSLGSGLCAYCRPFIAG